MPTVRILAFLAVLAGLITGQSASQAAVLYQNSPNGPGNLDPLASQVSKGPGNSYLLEFSHFTLGKSASISAIDWQGLYFPSLTPNHANSPAASAFQVLIYGNSSGKPDPTSVLFNKQFTIGSGTNKVSQSFAFNDSISLLGGLLKTSAAVYNYALHLSTPISVMANTEYRLSVAIVSPNGFGDQYWGWNAGGPNAGPDVTYAAVDGTKLLVPLPQNRTFTLEGGWPAVPEPSTAVLWSSLGALGIAFNWWRQKCKVP